MWLRTVMNYQYAHGGSATEALRHLWAEGSIININIIIVIIAIMGLNKNLQ